MSSKLFAVAALALSVSHVPTLGQPSMVGKFNDWGLYSYQANGSNSCYVLTMPQQARPASVDHGENYFLVAPKPSGSGFYPQAIMGYELRNGSRITVTVDDRSFTLIPDGNSGWTQQESTEAELVAAMKSGREMTLTATSRRGTQTDYVFSLSGVTAALQKAGQCN